jgi:hypothetical protein
MTTQQTVHALREARDEDRLPYPVLADSLPTGSDLAQYLSMSSTISSDVTELLDDACTVAAAYELSRLSLARMQDAGAAPPATYPVAVVHAILMRAAAVFRRRNSVNGFEGFGDMGALAIRASDPDIERLVDAYRAWCFA